MPLNTITGTQTTQETVASFDTFVLTKDANLLVNGSDALVGVANGSGEFFGADIVVLGTIATNSDGIDFFNNFGGSSNLVFGVDITIGATGSVVAGDQGVFLQSGTNSSLTNHGDIIAAGQALELASATASSNGTFTLLNTGNMTSTSFSPAVQIGSYTAVNATNTGTIGQTGGVVAITVGTGSSLRLNNSGVISGSSDNLIGFSFGSSLNLTNTGEIFGAFAMQNEVDIIRNSGLIDAPVLDLNGGDDTYRASGDGFVTGYVDGGANNDILIGASQADDLRGGLNNDFLRGNDGDDNLLGEGGFDTVSGGDGNDTVNGGNSDDTLRGGSGDDFVFGDFSNDYLHGGTGEDTVSGGSGDDDVRGGAGNDIVDGGRGQDELRGGLGNDVFVFDERIDSTNNADRDVIHDFRQGQDLIDLSGLPGAFSFVGTSGFSGTGREVRYVTTAAGDTTIFVDTTGNGAPDMRILVTGDVAFEASDFIL